MLVLTRARDQEIRIGDAIIVRVLDVKGDRVRIGIDAPPEVSVHRQEVYLEIERANRDALAVAGKGLEGAQKLMSAKATLPRGGKGVAARLSNGNAKSLSGATHVLHREVPNGT